MRRTTVMLLEDLKAQATSHAQKAGMSLGELIREALTSWLDRCGDGRSLSAPFFADKTVFDGPCPPDLSARHDGYLYGQH